MRILAGMLAVLIASTNIALAGEIIAKASKYFCEMTVVTCLEGNLNSCPPVFTGQIYPGQTVSSSTGQICYRHSKIPGDCNSGLTPNWVCDTNTGSEPHEHSID
jgi:predicted secreted Zn-dependent protease